LLVPGPDEDGGNISRGLVKCGKQQLGASTSTEYKRKQGTPFDAIGMTFISSRGGLSQIHSELRDGIRLTTGRQYWKSVQLLIRN